MTHEQDAPLSDEQVYDNRLAQAWQTLLAQKAELNAKHKADLGEIEKKEEVIKTALHERLLARGSSGTRTEAGWVTLDYGQPSFRVADPAAVAAWVNEVGEDGKLIDPERVHIYQKRATADFVKTYIQEAKEASGDDNAEDQLPPGIDSFRPLKLTLTKNKK